MQNNQTAYSHSQNGQAGGGPYQPHQSDQERIHSQRMQEIKSKAASMKGALANNGRCPKCTLKPPCKHFDSVEALSTANGSGTPNRGQQSLEFYPSKAEQSASVGQRSDGFSIASGQAPSSQGGQSGIFQASAQ